MLTSIQFNRRVSAVCSVSSRTLRLQRTNHLSSLKPGPLRCAARPKSSRRSPAAQRAHSQPGRSDLRLSSQKPHAGDGSLPGKHRRTTTLRTAPCRVTTIKTERLCDRYGQLRQISDELGKVGKTRGETKTQARSHIRWAWVVTSSFTETTRYQHSTNSMNSSSSTINGASLTHSSKDCGGPAKIAVGRVISTCPVLPAG